MNRNDITEKIMTVKVSKGIKWEDVAQKVGLSKEWTTAACLGQMTLDAKQAKIIGKIFGLNAEEQKFISNNIASILKAKLQDSIFFYREDSKVSLREKARVLDGLVFVKNAGVQQFVLRFLTVAPTVCFH